MSVGRCKIQLQAEEIDEEKWTKLKGKSIVSAAKNVSEMRFHVAFVKEMWTLW